MVRFQRIKMSTFYPELYEPFGRDINVTVDLSNYARKADLKNATDVDTSSFASKTTLATLKTEVDKLDIDKLAAGPTDLSKLSNVVKNDVVTKVNNIDTNDFVLKSKYDTDKTELENKIPSVTDFVKETKFTELENKISDIINLATKTELTVCNLVKKTDYNTKVTEIENKFTDHNHD